MSSTVENDILFDLVPPEHLHAAIELEKAGYPPDEAGTLEGFKYRQEQAPELFLGAYISGSLVGFICSTQSPSLTLTHESMSQHVPNSPSICIHSVCVDQAHRRRGIGLKLLKEFVRRAQAANKYERILLICHDELIRLYELAGFVLVGKSVVHHGSREWFEMRIDLERQIPAGILEALASQSSRGTLTKSRTLAEFPDGGVVNLIVSGTSANEFDLLCPREKCGSIILKAGVGKWVERDSIQIDPPQQNPHPDLPALKPPPQTENWWLVTPSPMAFENIGFSKPVAALQSTSEKPLKLLACAECDLGPLGWCEQGGQEFWLACSRVRYRVNE